MKIIPTSFSCKKNFLSALLASLIAVSSLGAQSSIEVPGPVSVLTINELNQIECNLHIQDAVANRHHSMGKSEATLSAGAQSSVMRHKKTASGAEFFILFLNFDPNFSPQLPAAISAYVSAVETWSVNLSSDVPIYIAAVFQPLNPGVLGSTGPTGIFANYPGMERETWYVGALADKLAGTDLNPSSFDIVTNFSTVYPNWYFGTDGSTPAGDFDFKTVVLHELAHGLGFFGSMRVDNPTGIGFYGFGLTNPLYPTPYDRLAYTPAGKSILKDNRYPNLSTALGAALLNGPLTAKGPTIKTATTGRGGAIFTTLDSDIFGDIPGLTDVWLPGSSFSHVDYVTYFASPDGLMVPFLPTGLSYSEPGDLTLAVLADIGWNGKVTREVMARIDQTDAFPASGLREPAAPTAFPNPVKDILTVNLDGVSSPLEQVSLIDVLGRKIPLAFDPTLPAGPMTLDLAPHHLPPGHYVLQLILENKDFYNLQVTKAK